MSGYIIKNNNSSTIFYYKLCGIYKITEKNGNTGDRFLLTDNSREKFSIIYGNENTVIYQSIGGDINMLLPNGKTTVILKNTSKSVPDIQMKAILGEQLRLIYNAVRGKNHQLYTQVQRIDKQWSSPVLLDTNLDYSIGINIAELAPDLHILIYAKKMPELQFGYIELGNDKTTAFKPVYTTGYNIFDFSYVVTFDSIHFVFVVSSSFCKRLVYVKKTSDKPEKPVDIYTNINIQKCLIGIKNGRLFIWWSCGRLMYCVESDDFGTTFGKIKQINSINTNDISKSDFIDKTNGDNIFNQIFVSKENPSYIYFWQ